MPKKKKRKITDAIDILKDIQKKYGVTLEEALMMFNEANQEYGMTLDCGGIQPLDESEIRKDIKPSPELEAFRTLYKKPTNESKAKKRKKSP